MKKRWQILPMVLFALLSVAGCESEPAATGAKTTEARSKYLGTGPTEAEKAKMREEQAKMPTTMGASSAQAEAMKRRPAKP